ncbi:XRE family transcriptional regulator [Colidextribacter sp. OB.20]|uniref:helix-turn-helix domain-containing protein n=1 Tax=Colidextribacter sp. OB.20 TaxID=2304568 RepID=UPI00136EBF6B|nr:helix-turn-helix transcriptional regulator [Colidextribacter sp. OB.20]NBI10825.1 XRE family transcriptional regulator [Colidextribacter sp. OB.20]
MIIVRERLKLLRKEKKLTQVQVAEFLKVTPRAYQYYEGGSHIPELPNLVALADFYDVSMDYLIGRSETRERQP